MVIWRNGFMVKVTCCSCWGSGFSSQNPHDGSQPSLTQVPTDLTPSYGLSKYQPNIHVVHTHTFRQKKSFKIVCSSDISALSVYCERKVRRGSSEHFTFPWIHGYVYEVRKKPAFSQSHFKFSNGFHFTLQNMFNCSYYLLSSYLSGALVWLTGVLWIMKKRDIFKAENQVELEALLFCGHQMTEVWQAKRSSLP